MLQAEVDSGKIPGAVILVKNGNRLVYRHAYGYAQKCDPLGNTLPHPEKTSMRHLYDIASLTKVIGTTTAIMLLDDQGLIHVDDPLGKYLPAFDTSAKKAITLRHLLTHTAGLYEWYPMYYRAADKAACYQLIDELPLKYPVGERRAYSDLGFVLLGEVIELVSGKSLDQFMAENIFQPLDMKHTTYNPLQSGHFRKIAATSHGNPYETRMVNDSTLGFRFPEIDPASWNGWRHNTLVGEVNDGNAWYANGGISGAAGIFSTIGDLQKLVDLLQHKGLVKGKQFLSAATIDTFLKADTFLNGLGWMMDPANAFMKDAPAGSFGHTGFTGTSIAVVSAHDLSIILLINRQNVGLLPSGAYYNLNPVREKVFRAVIRYGVGE